MALRRKNTAWTGEERRGPPTVLIVNDDDDARELLVRFLAQAGFSTDGARADTDTLAKMTSQLPRCVVLDMSTGGVGSSLKVLDQIRTHSDRRISSARVVLCAPSPRNRAFSFQSGADAFVIRPFHLNDLIDHIVDVVDRPDDQRARHRRDQLTDHP